MIRIPALPSRIAMLLGASLLVAAALPRAGWAADLDSTYHGRDSGVIEVVPRLDHHYRTDMVEPGWRMYGAYSTSAPPDYDQSAPLPGSLGRIPNGGCDPWPNACRPAQPWWTQRRH